MIQKRGCMIGYGHSNSTSLISVTQLTSSYISHVALAFKVFGWYRPFQPVMTTLLIDPADSRDILHWVLLFGYLWHFHPKLQEWCLYLLGTVDLATLASLLMNQIDFDLLESLIWKCSRVFQNNSCLYLEYCCELCWWNCHYRSAWDHIQKPHIWSQKCPGFQIWWFLSSENSSNDSFDLSGHFHY